MNELIKKEILKFSKKDVNFKNVRNFLYFVTELIDAKIQVRFRKIKMQYFNSPITTRIFHSYNYHCN